MSLEELINKCKEGVQNVKTLIDKHATEWNTYKTTMQTKYNDKEAKKTAYNAAVQAFKTMPKTIVANQGTFCSTGRCQDNIGKSHGDCAARCSAPRYTYETAQLSSVSGRSVPAKSVVYGNVEYGRGEAIGGGSCTNWCKFWDCCDDWSDTYYRCYCWIPEQDVVTNLRNAEREAWIAYDLAQKEYDDYVWTGRPGELKTASLTCCINEISGCVEGDCTGIIQTCKNRISIMEQQLSSEQQIKREEGYKNYSADILTNSTSYINNLNNNITVLNKNLNNIKQNILNINDVNSIISYVENIYNASTSLTDNMNTLIKEFEGNKSLVYEYLKLTRTDSIFYQTINFNFEKINQNFTEARNKWVEALEIYKNIKFEYETLVKDKKNTDNMKKILDDTKILNNNIDKQFDNINSLSQTVEQKKNSTNEEDIKSINKLYNDANNILNTSVKDYLNTLSENVKKVNFLLKTFGPNAVFRKFAVNYNDSINNINTDIQSKNNLSKNVVIQMKNKYESLINDLNNYNNIESINQKIKQINIEIDKNFQTFNNFLNLAKNTNINNEEDIAKLEKIKNDTINYYKNQIESFDNINNNNLINYIIETFNLDTENNLSKNIISILNLKDLSNKYLKEISSNSIFYNRASTLNNENNNLVEKNENEYKKVIDIKNNIENIFLEKKDIFLGNTILLNEDIIQSDKKQLDEIKKNELTEQNNKNNSTTNYTLYIIIAIVGLLFFIYIFTLV